MKTQGYIHDGWFVLRLPEYIDTDYFYYLLTSPNVQEQIQLLANGAIVKNISGDLVKQVNLIYPKSLSEQKRIVAILDEAFAAIDRAKANVEKNLRNARELFESYLQGVFENPGEDWEERKLEEVLEKTETIDPTKTPNKQFIYIDVSSVNKENLTIENITPIIGKDAPSRARKLISNGSY